MKPALPSDKTLNKLGPETPETPLVLSVPHAGRDYPSALLNQSRLSVNQLRLLEDRFVDRLVEPLAADGFTIIIANTARAWIDLNRSEREIDPEMVRPAPSRAAVELSPKVKGGLGLVPRRLSRHGDIYRGTIDAESVGDRIRDVYRPYHAALSDQLAAARNRFGSAVLLDCHSMPPLQRRNDTAPAQIVVGDRNGRSAAPAIVDRAVDTAVETGYRTVRNTPYAGGHCLARHGRPEGNIHALQLEMCRSLYLDFDHNQLFGNWREITDLIRNIADAVVEETLNPPQSMAAE